MHYTGYHQSQQEKEHRLPNHTFSQVHRSKQVFSYQSQIIPFFTSFLLCGKILSHTSFQIFLKVALTYPLLITAYFIFMAVFLPKAISLLRKPCSQASRSGLWATCRPVKKNVVLPGHTPAVCTTLLITSMGYRTVSSQNSLSSISFLSARNRDLTTRSSMHDQAPCLLPKLVPTTTQCYP